MKILIFLIIIQALCVLLSKNPITAVLHLVSVYILTAIIFLFLGAEFISISFLIIYVGAIAIVFIFVIMMLNIRVVEVYDKLIYYVPIGILLCTVFIFEVGYILYNHVEELSDIDLKPLRANHYFVGIYHYRKFNINRIAELLFNHYFYLVIIAGLLLLLAVVGTLTLTADSETRGSLRKMDSIKLRVSRKLMFWRQKN